LAGRDDRLAALEAEVAATKAAQAAQEEELAATKAAQAAQEEELAKLKLTQDLTIALRDKVLRYSQTNITRGSNRKLRRRLHAAYGAERNGTL
jgi:hypothetical protein